MANEDIRDLEAAVKSKEAELAEVHKLVGKRVAHLLEDPEALAAARASGHVQSALKCEAVHDIQSNFSMRDQRSMLDVHGISKRQWDALFGALQSAVNKTEWGKRRTNILVSSEVLAALKQIMDADFVEVYKPQPLSDGKGWRIDARRAMQTLIVNNQLRQSEYDTVTCIWQADGAPWGSNWDAIFMRFKDASKSLGPNARYGCGLQDSSLNVTVCAYIGKENREVSYICMIQVFKKRILFSATHAYSLKTFGKNLNKNPLFPTRVATKQYYVLLIFLNDPVHDPVRSWIVLSLSNLKANDGSYYVI